MSNISEVEERLFLLLDTVEKQAEQNAQIQQQVREVTAKLHIKTDSLTADAEEKIDVTQQRFDNIVYLSTKHLLEQNFPTLLENVIRENADFKPVEDALDNAVQSLNERVNGNSSLYNIIHESNLKKSEEIAESLEYQQEKLGNEYFKLIAIIGGGIFAIMCVFFFVMYLVLVPTESKSERLRQEQLELSQHIRKLSDNRQKWLQDAQRNGYPKN